MSERVRRILIISGFSLLVLIFGFLLYWYTLRPVIAPLPPEAPLPPVAPPTVGLPPAPPAPPRPPVTALPPPKIAPPLEPSSVAAGSQRPTETAIFVPQSTLTPVLAADGQTLNYYSRADGKFYRINSDGTTAALSDQVFFNVSRVTWSPGRDSAILEYPDGSNIVYNFETLSQITLPAHWQAFSFSPTGDQIGFLSIGLDRDARWLGVSSLDGQSTRAIEALGDNASKVQTAWSPNNQILAFSKTGLPQGLNEQEILLIGFQGENFRSLVVNGIGFKGTWSPDGTRILYSVSSGDNDWLPEVWIVEGTPGRIGANKTRLGLATWADKCAFGASADIYCAVPENLPKGAGLYPAAVGNTPDRIWKINGQTGARELVAIPSLSTTVESLLISNDERNLYLTDKISGQIYKINLR